jgi:hypothetical protein
MPGPSTYKGANRWIIVGDTADINFGTIQIYCFRDLASGRYRYKTGSRTSNATYRTLIAAQHASLKHVEVICEKALKVTRSLPEYDRETKERIEEEQKLDDFHLSILGLDGK